VKFHLTGTGERVARTRTDTPDTRAEVYAEDRARIERQQTKAHHDALVAAAEKYLDALVLHGGLTRKEAIERVRDAKAWPLRLQHNSARHALFLAAVEFHAALGEHHGMSHHEAARVVRVEQPLAIDLR
jgi:hypothetical protein